ncbi:nucleotidyltransferase domain-containing protein [Actinomadura sp. ATCC 31491]|uniref:Nucleotidyltransferase domain-containing protein n=1 Tax=Actinomadura luzonensis TaxID=2805427 RepID=A0ABT0G6M8_9ACTN|nr:nucleotidyltransferase domain-containing protein [Actinomadura luzonensis]MCK2220262.1 nucleotidyltransferase domain-containing protein [Actinomadura luzonensis]
MTLPGELARAVSRYLAVADRLAPGLVAGCYVVGSAALGAWRPDVSDIDVVAVLDPAARPGERELRRDPAAQPGERELRRDPAARPGERELRRLSLLHKLGNLGAAGRALARRHPHIPHTVNAVFVAAADLGLPVTRIRPVASHSGPSFRRGRGFDVNPVMWTVLAERGIAVRGPAPGTLGLDPEPGLLRPWTLAQLRGHWARYATRAASDRPPRKRLQSPYRVALAQVLSPPRLHRTVATGEVVSKEEGVAYALDVFGGRWHPLLRLALARRLGSPAPAGAPAPAEVPRLAGAFIHEVVTDAGRLGHPPEGQASGRP